jgi:hypothetical protein
LEKIKLTKQSYSRSLLIIGILIVFLAGCRRSPATSPALDALPAAPLYVIAGGNVGDGFRSNALTVVDATTLSKAGRTALAHSWIQNPALDPSGRIWIGYAGDMSVTDRRLQILGPDGKLETELTPCVNPEGGIQFTGSKAFVLCSEDGFSASVVRIDLGSLQTEQSVPLSATNGIFLLLSSGADAHSLLVAGLGSGPDDTSYTTIFILSLPDLSVTAQVDLGPDTYISAILPHEGRFYLLNTASWRPDSRAADLLIFDPRQNEIVESLMVAPAPLWGAFQDDMLWIFHNPFWGQPNDDPTRAISRIDTATGESRTWPLPDNWRGYDLEVVNNQVFLASWQARSDADDGIYSFDPDLGDLTLRLAIPDASAILSSGLP